MHTMRHLRSIAAAFLILPTVTACRVQAVTKGPCNAPTSTPTGGEAHATAVKGADHEVSGQVRDAQTGKPVSRAVIELSRGGLRQTADTAGRFTFRDVPYGTFTILARRYDYASQSAYLTLPSGSGLDVQFDLGFLGCDRVGSPSDPVRGTMPPARTVPRIP